MSHDATSLSTVGPSQRSPCSNAAQIVRENRKGGGADAFGRRARLAIAAARRFVHAACSVNRYRCKFFAVVYDRADALTMTGTDSDELAAGRGGKTPRNVSLLERFFAFDIGMDTARGSEPVQRSYTNARNVRNYGRRCHAKIELLL